MESQYWCLELGMSCMFVPHTKFIKNWNRTCCYRNLSSWQGDGYLSHEQEIYGLQSNIILHTCREWSENILMFHITSRRSDSTIIFQKMKARENWSAPHPVTSHIQARAIVYSGQRRSELTTCPQAVWCHKAMMMLMGLSSSSFFFRCCSWSHPIGQLQTSCLVIDGLVHDFDRKWADSLGESWYTNSDDTRHTIRCPNYISSIGLSSVNWVRTKVKSVRKIYTDVHIFAM